jgi:phosphogluconate dehydratase
MGSQAAGHHAELQQANHRGLGRELFAGFRRNALSAEEGACTWLLK